ncbi:MAG: protein kinase [Solirubrobacterales bacterium]|nr:protein kinase [Solirubrobacterales bacterium]
MRHRARTAGGHQAVAPRGRLHSEQLERFRREARAVAQLSHPHIVTVIDAGEVDGSGPRDDSHDALPYIVLEFVDGRTLKEVVRRTGPMDIPRALAYTIEIARALGTAHEHMIVHRDVKPQNVLIGEEGSAKITDFGIARSLTEQGLTLDGRVLGTTDYVSPEQALGEPVTPQSDIYSLGVVLYELLTGEVPFRDEAPVAVAMRHVREEVPDVQLHRPEVSALTAAVVDRATAKDLRLRYRDIPALVADLEDALAIETARTGEAGGEVTTVLRTLPAPARRRLPFRVRHPARWAASFAVAAALIALVLALALHATHRGTGVAVGVSSRPGLEPVPLAQEAAQSYNPFGTGPEDARQVANTVDGDPTTTWSTEQYYSGTLQKAGGTGAGIYLDANPGVQARAIEIQTTTPGFGVRIYAADHIDLAFSYGDPAPLTARGWLGPIGSARYVHDGQHIALSADAPHRYYLVWITTLPPGQEAATIAELTLFKQG